MTTENAPFMGLKLIVHKVCKDLKHDNELMLSLKKESALNNFLSSYPTIIIKGTTTSAIKNSSIYNSMVDDGSYTNPDMMDILNTCKNKSFLLSIKQAVEYNLKNLYEEKMRVGMLLDERDTKYAGTQISNNSKTESWQRVKCLSYHY